MSDPGEITEDQLTEMEGRVEAASPGPWQAFVEGRDHFSGDSIIRMGSFDDPLPDMYVSTHDDFGHPNRVPDGDWDFIAHARQDVPRLVAEVRRLKELLAVPEDPVE